MRAKVNPPPPYFAYAGSLGTRIFDPPSRLKISCGLPHATFETASLYLSPSWRPYGGVDPSLRIFFIWEKSTF